MLWLLLLGHKGEWRGEERGGVETVGSGRRAYIPYIPQTAYSAAYSAVQQHPKPYNVPCNRTSNPLAYNT